MTIYNRTDYYTCGHTYSMDRHGRQIRLAKCPVCDEGDYDGSLIKTDDKGVRSMLEEDSVMPQVLPSSYEILRILNRMATADSPTRR